jgi:dipeptidyl aminopeptidase/acylaminoacyl peptidase
MNRCLALSSLALALTLASPAGAAGKPMDVRDLANFERVSAPVLSADGRKLVFAVRATDFAANKGVTGLWIEDLVARDAAPPCASRRKG